LWPLQTMTRFHMWRSLSALSKSCKPCF
jgi:hypothetical protein